jgi:hypothetical protein
MNKYVKIAQEWLHNNGGHDTADMVVSLAELLEREVQWALSGAAESAWQAENRPEYP